MTYQHIDRSDPANQPQSGRHAGTCKRVPWSRWAQVTALAVALSFLGAFFLGTVAPAQASVVRPQAVNWTQRTCAAERAYVQHPTTARLDVMAADSFHVPWRYVGQDAWGLYSDVRSGSTKYVSKDESYFASDCAS